MEKETVRTAKLMHACRFSVDCKMFGAYCYLSEIRGTIPLLHGPVGCAFFPKLVPPDAIRTQLLGIGDPPAFPCTDMDERDIVYGGADKLRDAIIKVDNHYRPDLIGVIISCPAAIIGDDVVDIVGSVRDRVHADIIHTPSSAGFADEERVENMDRHAEDLINIWKNPDEKPKWGIETCGRLDTLYSLIEQLVEAPVEKLENTVNIDTYGRFHFFEDLAGELIEIKTMLKNIGIGVNTVFPGCSVKAIKSMARARLNVMRRSEKSAKFLKAKFGMDYIFDFFGNRYIGFEGARQFYMDIAERFDRQAEAREVLGARERDLQHEIESIRREIKGKTIAYISTPIFTTPMFLTLLEMFGLEVKMLCINTHWWRRWGMSKQAMDPLIEQLKSELKALKLNLCIHIDLTIDEEVEKIKQNEIDLTLGDVIVSDIARTMYYENHGINALSPHCLGYSSFRISFSQIARLGRMIAARLNRRVPDRNLLYFRYHYHPHRFPSLMSDVSDERKWEKIMQQVWKKNDASG